MMTAVGMSNQLSMQSVPSIQLHCHGLHNGCSAGLVIICSKNLHARMSDVFLSTNKVFETANFFHDHVVDQFVSNFH